MTMYISKPQLDGLGFILGKAVAKAAKPAAAKKSKAGAKKSMFKVPVIKVPTAKEIMDTAAPSQEAPAEVETPVEASSGPNKTLLIGGGVAAVVIAGLAAVVLSKKK